MEYTPAEQKQHKKHENDHWRHNIHTIKVKKNQALSFLPKVEKRSLSSIYHYFTHFTSINPKVQLLFFKFQRFLLGPITIT